MAKTKLIPIKILRQLLRFDRDTGKLFWKVRSRSFFPSNRACSIWNSRYSGKEAFTHMDKGGYLMGRIFNVLYRAHRVIWAIVHGVWPTDNLDHIDHNRSNNRIENLRLANNSANGMNASLSRANKSGFCGVYFHRKTKKWWAFLTVKRKRTHIGVFNSRSDAIKAREKANPKYGFHQNHGLSKEATQT